MRSVYPFCIVLILFASGCADSNQQTQPNVYYDVLSFVKRQITDLSAQKPVVHKTTVVNEKKSEEKTQVVNWNREFELFAQADINKPALRNSYQISRPDSLTYQYTLKSSDEKLAVQSLTVRLDSVTHQPRLIEATLLTHNPLYSSERHLVMESGLTDTKQWQVRHYKLSGYQKLPYFDRNDFMVEGKLD